jgi:spermidine synthase
VPPPGPVPRGALAAAFLCGLFGLGLELAGLRVMVFFVEGFTVCFAAMLAVWIAGLGLGSLVVAPLLDRVPHPSSALCLLLGLAGATAFGVQVVTIGDWDAWLVSLRGWAFRDAAGEADLLQGQRIVALAGAGILLFLPALFLGAAFPVCVRWARLVGAPPSLALGRVYLWNSLGTLAAPAVVTFVLVPWHGVLGAWQLVAIGTGATCLAFSRSGPPGWWRFAPWVSVGMVVFAAFFGGYRDATLLENSHVLRGKSQRKLLEVRTDSVTTASAVESKADGERTLYTDDFAAAATGRHSRYMRLLGHLPVLLAREPENALVIAFGTGTTAGAVAKHPEVKRLEVAEVSRAVLDLAGHFREFNGDVLSDPRTRVLVDDGRDALLLHAADLDVITLEPLMPYSPAGLPFYTREFYELARDRLRKGGVVCQWVPVHAMPVGLYAALLRTFFEVFPEGGVWFFEQSTALIATKGAGKPSREVLEARFAALQKEFAAAGYASLDLLASAHVAGGAVVLAQPGPEPERAKRTVTDMDPWPEFHATPRGVRSTYLGDTLAYLVDLAEAESNTPGPFGGERLAALRLREGTTAALKARTLDALGEWLLPVAAGRGGNAPEATRKRLAWLDEAVAHYVYALERLPGESALLWRRARAQRAAAAIRVVSRFAEARGLRTKGKAEEAAALEAELLAWSWPALALEDGDPVASQRGAAARLHEFVLLRLGRCGSAEKTLRDAAAALGETEEAASLRAEADVIKAYAAGGAAGPNVPKDWSKDLPPCRVEGLASLRPLVDTWRRALDRGQEREIRLAAENLLAAAAAESAQAELLAEVRVLAPGEAPTARAWRAALLARLDADDPALPELLSSTDAAIATAALEAAGASRALRLLPLERLEALTRSSEAGVREALASALGADGGAREVTVLVALLSDANRGVRAAAVAALLPHDDKDMADYDPDGTAESWAKVQERLRSR